MKGASWTKPNQRAASVWKTVERYREMSCAKVQAYQKGESP